jgi:ribosomal protein L11 methyltransferase
MPWLKLTLRADQERAPTLAETLEESGAISVTMEDAADEPVFETQWEQTPLWSTVRVTGLFPEATDAGAILARVRDRLGLAPAHEIERLEDSDWAERWKEHWKPVQVGARLWVVPSWHTPPDPAAVNLILDPGMAFGTGDHPTTALCLAWLEAQNLEGKDIVDYGCGSGILAIAALKLGARHAIGVDIDPQALGIARENAARNDVADRLTTCLPGSVPPDTAADVVIANILARPLVELAPLLAALVRPGGRIALSGLLAEQGEMVQAAYAAAFDLTVRSRHGWLLIEGIKRQQ